jgi:hypothetical protein
MGHLSGPQISVLALWSLGIVLAKSCGRTRVVAALANSLGKKEGNLRQRMREWCWDRKDKQGKQRVDWQVSQSFAPLLKWIISWWSAEERRLALAMDATTLKTRFVVLSISVVYRGCAIPVAWTLLPGNQAGSWKEPWLSLFQSLKGSIDTEWLVIVMADRGLYAKWLVETIQACHWHPFLRINLCSKYRPKGTADFLRMRQLLPAPGAVWAGRVTCFAHNSVEGTLLACWGHQHKEPWLILTDLPPEHASATWYGMRMWIELGFKHIKRGGWQWQSTHMTDPDRTARLWLALAVATLWVVSVGGEADTNLSASSLELLPPTHIARRLKSHLSPPRKLSCFHQGIIIVLTALLNNYSLPTGSFISEPWPQETYP